MGMGYQGFVQAYKTGPSTDPLLLLATGASVNLVLEPIYSTAVLGHGWYNAASASHYADNAIRYEGNIDFELQGSADGWNFMRDWLIENRAYPKSFRISPDGAKIYDYLTTGAYGSVYDNNGMFATSASFSASEGSFVNVSVGAVALTRVESDSANPSYISQRLGVIAGTASTFATSNPLNPNGDNVDPIPYWKTNAQLLTVVGDTTYTPFAGGTAVQAGIETVEWSLDLTSNNVILYTANGTNEATAVLMGPADVTGSTTLYHPDGLIDPVGAGLVAQTTAFRVDITGAGTIEAPAVVVEGDDYSIQGADAVTNRTYSIKGLGGKIAGSAVLPPLMMSEIVVTP